MLAWFAFLLALLALCSTPSSERMDRIESDIRALEKHKCTMMAVNTPTGTATVCVTVLNQDSRP